MPVKAKEPFNWREALFGEDNRVRTVPEPSDLDDPVWSQNFSPDQGGDKSAPDDDGAMTFGSEHHGMESVRTNSGFLDLLHHLGEEAEEEVRDILYGKVPRHELPEWLRRVLPNELPAPVDVRADVNPSASFHTDTFVIPVAAAGQTGGATLVSSRGDRQRIVVTNQGANPAYVSFTDDVANFNSAGGENAWIAIPNGLLPGNPRELKAGGKVYVYSPLGSTVDIQEEYGYKYREGGFESP